MLEEHAPTIESLNVDTIAITFGFLGWKEILAARVCKKFKEAAVLTHVPLTFTLRWGNAVPELCVDSARLYGSLTLMARALPNLHQMCLLNGTDLRFEDGDDPEPRPYDIRHGKEFCEIAPITGFRRLRSLTLIGGLFNGYYPSLFHFPYLRKLHIDNVNDLKLNLDVLAYGCPLIEDLCFSAAGHIKGDITSLLPFKDTLRNVTIENCPRISGDFMSLAGFPLLKKIDIKITPITGDVRKINDGDFPTLQILNLPKSGVYGFDEFDCVDDATEVMRALCQLKKRNGTTINYDRPWSLSENSPNCYDIDIFSLLEPPFMVEIVKAGRRVGYRWTNGLRRGCCEINWIDKEPYRDVNDHNEYLKELELLQADVWSYRGYYRPPTEQEYQRMSTHW
mmetsp:Transcript_5304/g.11506  ORF Transcript_5304/g.11506 Transcript_5304/m.11506 type:complete len:394 (+) Transcript_5304:39-1220(+)